MKKRKNIIRGLVERHGFLDVGFSKATFLDEDARKLEVWLQQQKHGKMSYMERNFDLRTDPRKLVPGSKTVISLLYNYYLPNEKLSEEAPKISMYAYGEDYHFVIKDKLRSLVEDLTEELGHFEGRVFVDSAPVLEKSWAEKSGLGWKGKNTNLINKKRGSFFFLAEIICDLEIEADEKASDHCGTCTKCIDACPTEALQPYSIDATKCISYLTIELRDEIPTNFKDKMDGWAFGCDICQIVCPWNRFSEPHNEPRFVPNEQLRDFNSDDWYEMTEEVFRKVFRGSALKRTKYKGLLRNLAFLRNGHETS